MWILYLHSSMKLSTDPDRNYGSIPITSERLITIWESPVLWVKHSLKVLSFPTAPYSNLHDQTCPNEPQSPINIVYCILLSNSLVNLSGRKLNQLTIHCCRQTHRALHCLLLSHRCSQSFVFIVLYFGNCSSSDFAGLLN